jgi:hypothetical protein
VVVSWVEAAGIAIAGSLTGVLIWVGGVAGAFAVCAAPGAFARSWWSGGGSLRWPRRWSMQPRWRPGLSAAQGGQVGGLLVLPGLGGLYDDEAYASDA